MGEKDKYWEISEVWKIAVRENKNNKSHPLKRRVAFVFKAFVLFDCKPTGVSEEYCLPAFSLLPLPLRYVGCRERKSRLSKHSNY